MSLILQLAEQPKKPSRLPLRPPKEKDAFAVEVAPVAPSTSSANLPGRNRKILVVDDNLPPRRPRPLAGRNRKILVVDDNPVVLKAFELKLKSQGFDVTTLSNASLVASTANRIQAELIILDINFPSSGAMEWTGFTIKQWLQRFPELAAIPVIMVTGAEAEDYRQKAMEAGAAAFFRKPISGNELIQAVSNVLDGKVGS